MTQIVVADIGGTNARFARADIGEDVGDGRPSVQPVQSYRVADYETVNDCWRAFADGQADLPDHAVFAVAAPLWRDEVAFTNSGWRFRQSTLAADLGLAHLQILNDYHAVAHAVAQLPLDKMPVLFGEDRPLPRDGAVTVLGPGTGLGVAFIAFSGGTPHPMATEGAHTEFAPLDDEERAIRDYLRTVYPRVSTERLACGPGLVNIFRALHPDRETPADADLWSDAIEGDSEAARHALSIFLRVLGSVTGDLALAQGSQAVVLTGSLVHRLHRLIADSDFHARFLAKGRYQSMMANIPIRLAVQDEIGLIGAATAYHGASHS